MASDISKLPQRFRSTKGNGFRLKDFDPADDSGLNLEDSAGELLDQGVRRIADLQERLYAQGHWAVLLIFGARCCRQRWDDQNA